MQLSPGDIECSPKKHSYTARAHAYVHTYTCALWATKDNESETSYKAFLKALYLNFMTCICNFASMVLHGVMMWKRMLLIFIYKFLSLVLVWDYCLFLNPDLKYVSPLRRTRTSMTIKIKKLKKNTIIYPLLIYSSIKKQGACPRGLNLFLHQAWMDTISDKTVAQLNYWNSTDCTTYEKTKKRICHIKLGVQTLCTCLSKRFWWHKICIFMQIWTFNQPIVHKEEKEK